jgi:Asp-tRNA(Asn)/Glu-tRNA(Gln) amidotransferase A subunit family amidase
MTLKPYVSQTEKFRSGAATPRSYLEECLKVIEERDPKIRAFIHLDKEGARRSADEATARWKAGKPLSAIDGMPVAIKDIIETIDMPTGQGSPLWEGFKTERDAAAVHALREAGAVIIGKTSTAEFAGSHPWPHTVNPHDPTRTAGGSSTGTAAAVGAGMVPAGLGTQVVGSILRPASFCGAVGYKPSFGGINRGGSYDYLSQSSMGVIAATLADTWAVARAISERAGGDPGFVGITGDVNFASPAQPKRFAVLETAGWAVAQDPAKAQFADAKKRLAEAGIELRGRADDPEIEAVEQAIADAQALTLRINAWEGRWPLNTYADRGADKLSAAAAGRLKEGEQMSQAEYAELIKKRNAAREAHARVAARYDACLLLGAVGAASVGFQTTGNTVMNVPASYLGAPAVTLPLLQDEGLPLGLQLIAGMNRDAQLFETASWVLGTFKRPDLIGAAA